MGKLRLLAAIGVLFGTFSSAQAGLVSHEYLAPGAPHTEDFVLGGTVPGKWGPAAMGTGATVTWSLMATGTSRGVEGAGTFTALADFMPAGFHAAITSAFAAWSAIADITFIEIADAGEAFNVVGASGDIRVGGHFFDGAGGVLAHGYYPPANGASAAGDIHFDTGDVWKLGLGGGGFNIFQVMAHEIGHAIGLDHTGVAASLMNPFYTEAFLGPQADDIAGAQFIYGAPDTTPEIPEPASMVLFALGAVALPFARRRLNPTTAA